MGYSCSWQPPHALRLHHPETYCPAAQALGGIQAAGPRTRPARRRPRRTRHASSEAGRRRANWFSSIPTATRCPDAAPDKNLVAGRLTMHRDGFGFVIPDASSLSPSMKSRLVGDIFIAPHAIGNAMHGDRVLVDIVATRPDGRAEGRIVRSVVRGSSHGGWNFSLRQPPQLCEADRQQDHAGNRDSGGHGISRKENPEDAEDGETPTTRRS